jgi:hypothetical protein
MDELRILLKLVRLALRGELPLEVFLNGAESIPGLRLFLLLVRWAILAGIGVRFWLNWNFYRLPEQQWRVGTLLPLLAFYVLYTIVVTIAELRNPAIRRLRIYLWALISIDVLCFSAFYFLTGTEESDFFLFYLLPIFIATEHFNFRNLVPVMVFTLACFSAVLYGLSPSLIHPLPNILVQVFLPRSLFLGFVGLLGLSFLEELDSFFDCLLNHIVLSRTKTGTSAERDRRTRTALEVVNALAHQLLVYAAQHLRYEFQKYPYMSLLGRQERLERSLGLDPRRTRPYWQRGEDFLYKQFLGAALLGGLRLFDRSRDFDFGATSVAPEELEEDSSGNTLINVGRLFQRGHEEWCVLLTGDMGTRFRLREDTKQIEISVSQPSDSPDECWENPSSVEMYYSSEVARILYRRNPGAQSAQT